MFKITKADDAADHYGTVKVSDPTHFLHHLPPRTSST